MLDQVETEASVACLNGLERLIAQITVVDALFETIAPETVNDDRLPRLVYVRNTLVIATKAWRDDVELRLERSRNGYCIYCMTAPEQEGFLRAMNRALRFSIDAFSGLAFPRTGHYGSVLSAILDDVGAYARGNKAVLKSALGSSYSLPDSSRIPEVIDLQADPKEILRRRLGRGRGAFG